ncbi:MAG: hypothetical protein K2X29_05415 [Candidatus Obscuribacterales bacterium]|nr:hypothetical protein [Candidatus Obscuribacterales bacterium]
MGKRKLIEIEKEIYSCFDNYLWGYTKEILQTKEGFQRNLRNEIDAPKFILQQMQQKHFVEILDGQTEERWDSLDIGWLLITNNRNKRHNNVKVNGKKVGSPYFIGVIDCDINEKSVHFLNIKSALEALINTNLEWTYSSSGKNVHFYFLMKRNVSARRWNKFVNKINAKLTLLEKKYSLNELKLKPKCPTYKQVIHHDFIDYLVNCGTYIRINVHFLRDNWDKLKENAISLRDTVDAPIFQLKRERSPQLSKFVNPKTLLDEIELIPANPCRSNCGINFSGKDFTKLYPFAQEFMRNPFVQKKMNEYHEDKGRHVNIWHVMGHIFVNEITSIQERSNTGIDTYLAIWREKQDDGIIPISTSRELWTFLRNLFSDLGLLDWINNLYIPPTLEGKGQATCFYLKEELITILSMENKESGLTLFRKYLTNLTKFFFFGIHTFHIGIRPKRQLRSGQIIEFIPEVPDVCLDSLIRPPDFEVLSA